MGTSTRSKKKDATTVAGAEPSSAVTTRKRRKSEEFPTPTAPDDDEKAKSSAGRSRRRNTRIVQEAEQDQSKKAKRSRSKSSTRAIVSTTEEATETAKNTTTTTTTTATDEAKPTMDVKVHRLRHLEYIPSPILAITSSSSGAGNGQLAVSRQDGSYELSIVSSIEEYPKTYSPHIYPVTKIAGSTLAVAHSLCWVPKSSDDGTPTCVAASPDGTFWIVNFVDSQLQCRLSSGGGGIFDLAVCQSSDLPVFATACQDGFVRLWQVLPNGTIRDPPIATLSTAGAPVLSLTWRLTRTQNGTFHTVLFAGVADGTIRKYKVTLDWKGEFVSVVNHSPITRMTMESKGRRTSTKVWSMQLLKDGTLISGNSLGQVQFWNSDTGTLIQSIFQSNLKSDVLQIAVNNDETKVFCTGVDSRVVCCERPSYKQGNDATPWILANAQRPHTHDVKAMTLVTSDDGRVETLATGGVDTKLCSYVVSDFSKRRPQVWYPWPSNSPVSTAPEHRIFSMQRKDNVELYRLQGDGASTTRKSTSDLVGTIKIETRTNLVTSSLSPNGKWLALCDATSLFVFGLEISSDGSKFRPQQIQLPSKLEQIAGTAIHFEQDTLFVAESSSNNVYVVDMKSMNYSVLSESTKENTKDSLPIHSIQSCGDFLMTLSHVRESGVRVYKRSSSSSYKPYWTIPSLSKARPAAATLIQGDQLAIATFTSKVYLFNLKDKRLSPWSEENGFPIEQWPWEMSNRRDFPVRLLTNPSNPSQLILGSFGTFCVMNLKETLPRHCKMVPDTHVRSRRKKRPIHHQNHQQQRTAVAATTTAAAAASQNNNNCIICLHYNSMLYLDFIQPKEMIVIEQPWLQVVASFPEAVQRRVYGCN